MTVRWNGDDAMRRNIDEYARRVVWAVNQVAQLYAAMLEAHAKANAPWTDRTANARQSLAGYVDDGAPPKPAGEDAVAYPTPERLAEDTVSIYLSHGRDYGVFLETKYAGRYAILWPTIEAHLPRIERALREIFS